MLKKIWARFPLHLFLFLLTFVSTTLAGAEWIHGKSFLAGGTLLTLTRAMTWAEVQSGLWFSVPFLGVLTVHEFGHYFTARHNGVRVTLPYYIPLWVGVVSTIGTMGAFIRIKDRIYSRREFFDIGIAGPLAGFAVALPLLWYAFTHLPPPEYIFEIHPDYRRYGLDYPQFVYGPEVPKIAMGRNLLFWFFETYVVTDPSLLPHKYELIHYPLLFSGYLALFFTALNLLPIGQLDGGHILYGLIGYRRFNQLSPILFTFFVLYAGMGTISSLLPHDDLHWMIAAYGVFLYLMFAKVLPTAKFAWITVLAVMSLQYCLEYLYPDVRGYQGWLVFAFILARVLGVFHPPSPNERPLNPPRVALGVLALVVFALCFSPEPFVLE